MGAFSFFSHSASKRTAALLLTAAFATVQLTLPVGTLAAVYAAEDEQQGVSITGQPQSLTAKPGDTVTFTVQAEGEGLSYQWYYRKAGAKSWSVWKGHTAASTSAAVNSSWNMMRLYCRVTDEAGGSADSDEAVVRVQQPLEITSQPSDVTAKVGDTVKFTVAAQGTGELSYQWYYRKAGAKSWSLWKGHTAASTSAAVNSSWNMMRLYCRVTDEAGGSADSDEAVIRVEQPLEITSQPEGVTAKVGDTVKFAVSAQGTGELSYQWYYRKAGADSWSLWKGHTDRVTSAVVNSTWNAMRLYCRVSDEAGHSDNTRSAVITVERPLEITSQPSDVIAGSGDNVKFSVTAQGTGDLAYQWYYRKAGADSWSLWKGHTDRVTYATVNDTWDMMQLCCKVTDQADGSADSEPARVKLKRPLVINSHPEGLTADVGDTVKFAVAAQGTGNLAYQWYYRREDADSWSLWKGHTSDIATATVSATWNMIRFFCRVTDESGASENTKSAVVKVRLPLMVTTNPKDTSVRSGGITSFSVKAQGTGKLSYVWYCRMPGENSWSELDDQGRPFVSIIPTEELEGMEVFCRVSDETGATADSGTARLHVAPPIVITSDPAFVTLRAGETARFSVTASGENLKYQWYYKKAGKDVWTLWEGKTSASVSAVADCTWHAMQVYCRVTDAVGQRADSSTAVAMITKKSDQRYINRYFTAKKDGTRIYSGPGTGNTSVGTVNKSEKYLALEWGSDSSDNTWYRFDWKGKTAWIARTNTDVYDEFVTIPDRSFKEGGLPVIYLSPSRQTKNEYAAGNTTEGIQMYFVGEKLKKILEEEYYCVVYMPPVEMPISLSQRPTDAYNKKADVYLAIHSNAHSTKTRYGAVGYYFPGSAQSKRLGEAMADEMGKISPFTPNVESKTVNGMLGFDNIGYAEVRDPA